ncbi:MAG TPA: hypothetical protein PKA64_10255 [Myxococcota bacterium]|nr:hypothetical protein [Myxococcota bacterium]
MRSLIALSLALAACEATPEETDLIDAVDPAMDELAADELAPPPVANACGDMTAYLRNQADTTALVLEIPGVVAAANAAGGTIRQHITLPDRRVTGELRTGQRVTAATCTGVIVPPGPAIRRTMTLSGGTIDLVATPVSGPPGMPPAARVDITLTDPAFTSPGAGTGYAGTFTWPRVIGGGYYP